MKKLLVLILTVVLMILPLCCASAADGDADGDGVLTAADARYILRASVGLENVSAAQSKLLDADRDGTLTASDARLVLRAGVGLAVVTSDGSLLDIDGATPKEQTGSVGSPRYLDALMIYGDAGYEYYNFVTSTADSYVAAVNAAGNRLQGKADVYDIIIPTSMDISLDKRVRSSISWVSDQEAAIDYMESQMNRNVKVVHIFDTLNSRRDEYLYFRTDHHWTELGAYYAYVKFCQKKGITPVSLADCVKRSYDGFYGTFYFDSGRASALAAHPDRVDTYMPPVNTYFWLTESSGNTLRGVSVIYNAENSSAGNKYGAFIWGDNPISVIENTDMQSGESCILVKESFGNAFAPLLCYNYKYVYIVDYRYYNGTITDLVNRYGIDDVIYCNNISMTRSASLVRSLQNRLG